MMSNVFVAKFPDGQVTKMSINGDFNLPRAVRVSWIVYNSRLKGRAPRKITIKSASFVEAPDRIYKNLDVEAFFRERDDVDAKSK